MVRHRSVLSDYDVGPGCLGAEQASGGLDLRRPEQRDGRGPIGPAEVPKRKSGAGARLSGARVDSERSRHRAHALGRDVAGG